MSNPFSLEIHRMVFDDQEGSSVCIRPSPENQDWIELTTNHRKESAEYFGVISLCVPREMAKMIGQALIAASEDTK